MKTIKNLPKVENMLSSNMNSIPNQFIIKTKNAVIFQSYSTIIAVKSDNKIYLDKNSWDYSVTTGKYRNLFLGFDKKETEKQIKNGQIILTDLNE